MTTCGVIIWDPRTKSPRTCGAKTTHSLIFRGDCLFGVCSRHNARVARAFPEMKWSRDAA